jgi:hypothetical protein
MASLAIRLIGCVVVLAASVAAAASDCEEGRAATGVTLVVRDGALTIDAVADGSVGASTGVHTGDVLQQVNGVVPRTCAEWAHAVKDARDGHKALLLLVSRPAGEAVLALGRRTWGEEVVEVPAVATVTPSASAHRPSESEPPPPLPDDVAVSLDSTVTELGGLLGRTRDGLVVYRDGVTHVRRAVETLAVRNGAPSDTVTALRRVARMHEAAVLAWQATDGIRERSGIPRRLPVSEALTAPYFSGSAEQQALDEYDFLHETVSAEPKGGRFTETSGEWRPAAARRLLWEHAGEALGGVAATLASAP